MRNPFFIIITFTSLSKNKQWISTKEAPLLPILGISTKISFHSYSSITTHQSEKRPLTYSAANADITFLPFLRRRANTCRLFYVLIDRKSRRLNSSHLAISNAVFILKNK